MSPDSFGKLVSTSSWNRGISRNLYRPLSCPSDISVWVDTRMAIGFWSHRDPLESDHLLLGLVCPFASKSEDLTTF